MGFEPTFDGFANRCLTTWLPRRNRLRRNVPSRGGARILDRRVLSVKRSVILPPVAGLGQPEPTSRTSVPMMR
jgi:hypothetical protein